jgi:hypothetical protein
MDILSRMWGITNTRAVKYEKTRIVYNFENGIDLPEHVTVKDYKKINVYNCTNIYTNK